VKIALFYFLILYSVGIYAFDVKDITKKIENMEATGNTYDKIDYEVYDPFAVAKPIITKSPIREQRVVAAPLPIVLQTILNQKALINNRWYDVGDAFREYKIQAIYKNLVVLAKESELKVINMDISHNKVNIKTKELN